MTLGKQLRQKRRELDLTQERVAQYFGITQQAYSKLETAEWVTKKHSGIIHDLEKIPKKSAKATKCAVFGQDLPVGCGYIHL